MQYKLKRAYLSFHLSAWGYFYIFAFCYSVRSRSREIQSVYRSKETANQEKSAPFPFLHHMGYCRCCRRRQPPCARRAPGHHKPGLIQFTVLLSSSSVIPAHLRSSSSVGHPGGGSRPGARRTARDGQAVGGKPNSPPLHVGIELANHPVTSTPD